MSSLSVIFNTPITTKILSQDLKGNYLDASGKKTTMQKLLQSAVLQKMVAPGQSTGGLLPGMGGSQPAAFTGGGVLTFDAVTRQQHGMDSAITQHPVEAGTTISDHIQLQPQSLTVDGTFSDIPFVLLGPLGAAAGLTSGGTGLSNPSLNPLSAMFSTFTKQMGLALSAYNCLYALWKTKSLLTIVTAWQLYKNMAIAHVSAPREDSRGRIKVSIDFQTVQIITANGAKADKLEPTINLSEVMPLFPNVVAMAQAAAFFTLLAVQATTGKGL